VYFYLPDDLIKADGVNVPPPTPQIRPPGGGGDIAASMKPETQPCSVGGGQACVDAGGVPPGSDTHRVGGATEQKHAEYRARQGAGAPQVETAAPAEEQTTEAAQQKIQEAAPHATTLDPMAKQGVTSTDPKDYPPDSHPMEHYKVAAALEAHGGDSAKEVAEGHRKIARERSKDMTSDQHAEIAEQLHAADFADHAQYHEQQADQKRAIEEEARGEAEGLAEKIEGKPPEAEKPEEYKQSPDVIGERAKEAKEEVKDKRTEMADEPHAQALQDWEEEKKDIEAKHEEAIAAHKEETKKQEEEWEQGPLREHKEKVDAEYEAKVKEWEDKHAAVVEEHKAKIDEEHSAKVKEWADKKKAHEDHKAKEKAHKDNAPEKPKPFTQPKPKASDYDDMKKFDKDKGAWEKAKKDHAREMAVHKTKKFAHDTEARSLAKQRPPAPGRAPGKPSYAGAPKKEAKPKKPTKADYAKGAPAKPKPKEKPKKPEMPEKPKAEDFMEKKPTSPAEKATHQDHTQRAQQAQDNIRSHLDGNPDVSPEDRKKLEQVHEGLEAHLGLDRMPSKEQAAELKQLEKLGGTHSKQGYEAPQEEEVRPPETAMEHAQLADHKAQVETLRSNIQSHLDAMEATDIAGMSMDQKEALTNKLTKLLGSLDKHAQLNTLPTSEQASELKEISKLAGEHGKKGYEPPKEGKAPAEKPAKMPKMNLAGAFQSGRRAGEAMARAAQDPYGAGGLGTQTLNAGVSGALRAGGTLLNTPRRAQGKRPYDSSKASDEATAERQTMKGLYLDPEDAQSIFKAVNSPNMGTTTDSDKRAQRKMKESYAKQPVGVMGGAGVAMEDDPDVGRQWKHSEEDSIDAELEEERKKKEDEKEKSLEVLKSLRMQIHEELNMCKHNPAEVEFMRDVLGYDEDAIHKGLVTICGKDRQRFHEWSLGRLNKSLSDMLRR